MSRHIVLAIMYLLPFSMMYGALIFSKTYSTIAVILGFVAGIVYAAVREAATCAALARKAGEDRG